MNENKNDLPDFPWEREGAFLAIETEIARRLAVDPDFDVSFDTLKERCREAFDVIFLEGLPQDENLARVMGCVFSREIYILRLSLPNMWREFSIEAFGIKV